MLGYCLTSGSFDRWMDAAFVWSVRLSIKERVSLTYAALKSLPPEDAQATAEAALAGAGMPQAPLFGFMDQANFWADMAEPQELAAYCLASFKNMASDRQAAFLDFVKRRAA